MRGSQMRRAAGILVGTIAVGAAVYWAALASNHAQSPESAQESASSVWIALLKGFNGDVYYVGSKGAYAYFRLGDRFWSYYKVPLCLTRLPREFPLGDGQAYVIHPRYGPFPGGKGTAIWIDVLPYATATNCPSPVQ